MQIFNEAGLVMATCMGPSALVTYHPLMSKTQAGDVFCTKNPMALGAAINFIERFWSSDGVAEYSHSGLLIDSNAMTLEADWHLENFCLFDKFQGDKVIIARPIGMTADRFKAGMIGVQKHIGQFYPLERLLLDALHLGRLFHWNKVVCSELVGKFLFKAGFRSYDWFGCNPDNLADEFHHMLNDDRTGPKYDIIFEGNLPVLRYRYCATCRKVWQVDANQRGCHIHKLLWDADYYLPDSLKKLNVKRGLS